MSHRQTAERLAVYRDDWHIWRQGPKYDERLQWNYCQVLDVLLPTLVSCEVEHYHVHTLLQQDLLSNVYQVSVLHQSPLNKQLYQRRQQQHYEIVSNHNEANDRERDEQARSHQRL